VLYAVLSAELNKKRAKGYIRMSEENKENIGEETVLEQKPQEEQEKGRTR